MEADRAIHLVTTHDDVESPVALELLPQALCPTQPLPETFVYVIVLHEVTDVHVVDKGFETSPIRE